MGPGPPRNVQNEISFSLSCSPNFVLLLRSAEAKALLSCLWGWGANNKDPLREGDGARILQMWGYSVSASPLGAAASLLQRPKYGTHLWVPKKKYPGDYESLSAPFTEPLGLPENSVCSPGLCETLIWIKLLPSLSTQLMAVLILSCNFSLSFHRETADRVLTLCTEKY